jgi:hypothetical protein
LCPDDQHPLVGLAERLLKCRVGFAVDCEATGEVRSLLDAAGFRDRDQGFAVDDVGKFSPGVFSYGQRKGSLIQNQIKLVRSFEVEADETKRKQFPCLSNLGCAYDAMVFHHREHDNSPIFDCCKEQLPRRNYSSSISYSHRLQKSRRDSFFFFLKKSLFLSRMKVQLGVVTQQATQHLSTSGGRRINLAEVLTK